MRSKRYREIFDSLRGDNESLIKYDTIDYSGLSREILMILKPLLTEIQDYSETLNYSDFSGAMDNLMQTLSTGEKDVLLLDKRKRKSVLNYTFHPKINTYKGESKVKGYIKGHQ